jgi:hypothetical protein
MTYISVDGKKTKIKKFDKMTYDEHDPQKFKAIEYFKKLKYKAEVNPKKMGVDLIVTKDNGEEFYCEVEVKNNWKGEKFPYEDVQVLLKKKKHFTLDKPSCLMMFNHERTHALFLQDKDILSSNVEEVSNRINRDGEFMFKVPVEKAVFVKV